MFFAVAALDGTGKYAILETDGRSIVSIDNTKEATGIVGTGGDRSCDNTVVNLRSFYGKTYQSSGILACRGDCAGHVEITNFSTCIMERSYTLYVRVIILEVDGQRMVVAQEFTLKLTVFIHTHHCTDGDVIGQ